MSTRQVNNDDSYEEVIRPLFTDCSRFWECSPPGQAYLYECVRCEGSHLCEGREALSFDVTYQYPEGPVCNYPAYVDCSRDVCDEQDPRPECCQDSECQNVGSTNYCPEAYCATSFNCVYPDSCHHETTTTTDYTGTWLPYPCLPYDGSEVPDCSKYNIDPISKWPAYVQHSYSNHEII